MLGFHEHIIGELLQDENGGLVVLGSGLGLHKIVASLIALHSASDGILLILSASDSQRGSLKEELSRLHAALPLDINNEYSSQDRVYCYSQGGAFFITSRILIVDLLNEKVPLTKVAGIILLNAHRLTETCTEAFIVRLYRIGNRRGYVRAFSDRPQSMISGFSKTERVMKCLLVRKLHLWPRFQVFVSDILEKDPPEVIDIRMPLTSNMAGIQSAIVEVMNACLKELRKTNKVDVEDLTVEKGLFKSFDEIVRQQLDTIWHIIGKKTKQLVEDLKTLRKLADYLVRYDAVTYLKYLDTLRVSEGVRSVWIFANPSHQIFELAKKRVYQIVKSGGGKLDPTSGLVKGIGRGRGDPSKRRKINAHDNKNDGASMASGSERYGETSNDSSKEEVGIELEVVGEEMPKWNVLREVLEEIEKERHMHKVSEADQIASHNAWDDGSGAVLVACKDERSCMQLQDCIYKGSQKLMQEEWEKYLLSKSELHGLRARTKKKNQGPKGFGVLNGKTRTRPKDNPESRNIYGQEQDALLAAAAEVAAREKEVIPVGDDLSSEKELKEQGRGRGRGRGGGRKRGRGRKNTAVQVHLLEMRDQGKQQISKPGMSSGFKISNTTNTKEISETERNIDGKEQGTLLAAAAEVAAREKEVIPVGDDLSLEKELKEQGRGRGRGGGRKRGRGGGRKRGRGRKNTAVEVHALETRDQGKQQRSKPGMSSGFKISNTTNAQEISETEEAALENAQNTEKVTLTGTGEKVTAERVREVSDALEVEFVKPVPIAHYYAFKSDQHILDIVKPSFIIVYDPDMAFVREIEVYKAENSGKPLKVYFLFYENSTEEQKFEASIQRENSAFESLIRQKSLMAIPVDQDGRCLGPNPTMEPASGISQNALTRKAGGRKAPEKQTQVIVDMREFKSSLPSVLHQQGMKIIPITLEVGDYILSPEICVERKSIADLFQSFTSGRLYHQAETMTRYYRIAVLLIEFSQDKSFSFQSAQDIGEDILQTNIISKLSLLVLHFPRLRLVWSRSLYATAEIFASLKTNQDEPDVSKAMRLGVPTEDGLIEGDIRADNFNTTAVEFLRRLPGVTDANYRTLMDGCKSLAELALLPLERLAELMGGQRPARMLRDFLDAKFPSLL